MDTRESYRAGDTTCPPSTRGDITPESSSPDQIHLMHTYITKVSPYLESYAMGHLNSVGGGGDYTIGVLKSGTVGCEALSKVGTMLAFGNRMYVVFHVWAEEILPVLDLGQINFIHAVSTHLLPTIPPTAEDVNGSRGPVSSHQVWLLHSK